LRFGFGDSTSNSRQNNSYLFYRLGINEQMHLFVDFGFLCMSL